MTETQSPGLTEYLPSVAGSITVAGDASGLHAIGTNITQVHIGRLGNLVTPASGPPVVNRRSAPVLALGRRPRRFLDREVETAAGQSAARAAHVVEFVGPVGAGKSTLLRELAHRLAGDARRGECAAVVLLDAGTLPVEDVLQELFGLLHETDRHFLPTGGELRGHLQGLDGYVLVDDVREQGDVARLMDVLPDVGLVLTAGCTHGSGDVQSLPLRGLPSDDAAAVVRVSGKSGAPTEERAVAELVQRLDGRPGVLATVAAGAGMSSTPLQVLAESPDPGTASLEALPRTARDVLGVLAAVPGLSLTAQEVAAVTGEPADGTLDALVDRGLVEGGAGRRQPGELPEGTPASAERYRATASTAELVRAQTDLGNRAQALLAHFDQLLSAGQSTVPTVQQAHAARLILLDASGRGRSDEVLRLSRAVEAVLALSGSWGSWHQVLTAMLTAARQLHDTEAESFALHQLGSRALCLGQLDEAERLLTEALRLRQDASDDLGAAVTERNLRLLTTPYVPPYTWWSRVWRLLRTSRPALLLAVLAAVALLTLTGWLIRSSLADTELPAEVDASWQLTPESLDFGELPPGRNTERSLSLTSTVGAGTAVGEARVTGLHATDFRVLRDDCGEAPGQGEACQITVAFSPGGQDERRAQLDLKGEDGRRASVPLRGTGTANGGVAETTPTALDFGQVAVGTTTGPRPVTVTNTGDAPLVLGGAVVGGPDSDEFRVDDQCPERLAPGDRCELLVRHTPKDLGARSATLTAGTSGQLSLPLTGTGFRDVDGTDPVITVSDMLVKATSPDGATVDLEATARDDVDGPVDVQCQPRGGQFPLGTIEVTCRAQDASGNEAEKIVNVTVADSTPPVLDLPQPDPVEATSLSGALVTYDEPTATDAVSGRLRVECLPASGTMFGIGSTTVRCSAVDGGGTTTNGAFEVQVRDTTRPVISEPPEKTVVAFANSDEGTPVQYVLPEAKDLGEPVTVACSPRSGATFPLGETAVKCAADDGRGNTSRSVTLTVHVKKNVE